MARFEMRVPDEVKEAWQTLANACGKTLTEWVFDCCNNRPDEMDVRTEKPKETSVVAAGLPAYRRQPPVGSLLKVKKP